MRLTKRVKHRRGEKLLKLFKNYLLLLTIKKRLGKPHDFLLQKDQRWMDYIPSDQL